MGNLAVYVLKVTVHVGTAGAAERSKKWGVGWGRRLGVGMNAGRGGRCV